MNIDRTATATEIATLEAIKTVVERHDTETKKIMETDDTTKLLRLALEDTSAAKALFAIDPDGLSAALAIVEEKTDRDNLVDTLHSLCDLGEGDAVARALKNVTLGAIQKNTGKSVPTSSGGAKITVGKNPSPVRYNGATVKRSPTKPFNNVVDAPTKAFKRIVSDNVNGRAKAIMREAIERKTAAAATLKTHPIGKGKEMNKQDYDSEETWTGMVKKEATGRMKSDTVAGKSVDIPSIRMADFNETRERLPPEFRNPTEIPNVVGMTLTDLPQPPSIKPPLHDPQSMAALTLKNHQMQQRQWNANLQSPAKPKQGFDPVNGAV